MELGSGDIFWEERKEKKKEKQALCADDQVRQGSPTKLLMLCSARTESLLFNFSGFD